MNWGLFLGCKVKTFKNELVGKSECYAIVKKITCSEVGIEPDWFKSKGEHDLHYFTFNSENMPKPILRPLSSMTEEEKKEMYKKYYSKNPEINCVYLTSDGYVLVRFKNDRDYGCGTMELFWLMSKGFYVNQCEETECIIEG
jgi:hypothetical protein